MWSSRDVSLIIIFSSLGLAFQATIKELPQLMTGIPGIGYILSIGNVIIINTAFLMFEGKRWRFAFFGALYTLLISVVFGLVGSNVVLRSLPMVTGIIIQDIIYNSVYSKFEKQERLKWLSIIVGVQGLLTDVVLRIVIYTPFLPSSSISAFVNLTLTMVPILLFNAIFGGYLAYIIYKRTHLKFE